MELLNHTAYEAKVVRTVLDGDRMLAVVVVKATYSYDAGGHVRLEDRAPLPIYTSYESGELGQIWPETFARKAAVDVVVFGRGVAPSRRPVTQLMVMLRAGTLEVRAQLFGPRVWRKRMFGADMSKPSPFVDLPLDWSHAFGGRASVRGQSVPYFDNPKGVGYVLDRDQLDGAPLPCIEDPTQPIRSWQDHPRPLAFAPLPPGSGLVDADDRERSTPPDASMSAPWAPSSATLNFAHPLLRVAKLYERDPVILRGVHPEGAQHFELVLPAVYMKVQIGHKTPTFHCKPDTLYLYPNQRRYAVVARHAFRYVLGKAEARVVRLYEEKDG